MGDFKDRIHELIKENKTEEALIELKRQASILKPSLKNDITILESRLNKNRRNDALDLEPSNETRREMNRIQDAILDILEKLDSLEQKSSYTDSQIRRKGTFQPLYLVIVLALVMSLLAWWFYSNQEAVQRCTETKDRAEHVLKQVLDTKKAHPDIIDEVRFLFWEGTLQNHINLTSCDSLNAINRDIEAAKNFLKRYE